MSSRSSFEIVWSSSPRSSSEVTALVRFSSRRRRSSVEAPIERGLEHLGERVEEVPFLGEKGALVGLGPRLAVHDVERPLRPVAGSKGGVKRPRKVAVPRRRPDDPRVTRGGFGDVGKLERRRQQTGDSFEQIGRGGGTVGKNARGLPERRQLLDALGEPVGHVGGVLRILHGRL